MDQVWWLEQVVGRHHILQHLPWPHFNDMGNTPLYLSVVIKMREHVKDVWSHSAVVWCVISCDAVDKQGLHWYEDHKLSSELKTHCVSSTWLLQWAGTPNKEESVREVHLSHVMLMWSILYRWWTSPEWVQQNLALIPWDIQVGFERSET